MIIVFGLGNPGEKYERTRHNLGSRIVRELERLNLKDVVLVRPTTFMNENGKAVKKIIKNYRFANPGNKFKIENLIVIHDDIDLPLGRIKIVKNRGSAGHKGVESIIREIRTKKFVRFRIGIQPKTGKPKNVEKFVLQNFNKEEKKILEESVRKTLSAIKLVITKGLERAMAEFNQ